MAHINKITSETILKFWFDEITPMQWWQKSEEFDRLIESHFGELHKSAVNCELYKWRTSANGRLAEIIVLDQFSRNIYRDHQNAFASDSLALALAQTAVSIGADMELNNIMRSFLYMPYMHSESALIHVQAVELFRKNGIEDNLLFEIKHKEIIDRFGRYPHRNSILARTSTQEEIEFLKTPGSSF